LLRGEKMHDIVQDKKRKVIITTLSGYIDVNQANDMLTDFKKKTEGVSTKDYVLIINPENISANIFVIPILQSFVKLVSELGFRKIYLVNSDKYAGIIKQQLANTDVAGSLRFASDVSEALKNI
jgi:hypothetical protein